MKHTPTIGLSDGVFVNVIGCSCGWMPIRCSSDTDDQFANHVALEILHGPKLGEGPQQLADRVHKLTAWMTDRLIYVAKYRDQYGEACYMGAPKAEVEALDVVVHILAGRKGDLEPTPITDADIAKLRELADASGWAGEDVDEVGELLPKLLVELDRLRGGTK